MGVFTSGWNTTIPIGAECKSNQNKSSFVIALKGRVLYLAHHCGYPPGFVFRHDAHSDACSQSSILLCTFCCIESKPIHLQLMNLGSCKSYLIRPLPVHRPNHLVLARITLRYSFYETMVLFISRSRTSLVASGACSYSP